MDWATMSDHERANIWRTTNELIFLMAAIALSLVVMKDVDDDDDDDWLLGFIEYQALRLKTELLFFTPKLDEAFSILRSPAASVSVLENIIELSGQIFEPLERYERGPWKGRLKIEKDVMDMIPMYRQYYRLRDISEQSSWFRSFQ